MSIESLESAAPLRVQLLGPVRAWRGEVEIALGSARQRALFAVLALNANQVVSREVLVDAIWGDQPPSAVDSSLYTYVSRLRTALDPARPRRAADQVLASIGSGYRLGLDLESLDVRRFDLLRGESLRSWERRDAAAAKIALDQALDLWGGEPLAGIEGPFAAVHREQLAELHLNVLERRAQMMLELGDAPAAIAELVPLAAAHPLRETPRGLLMTALRNEGRDDEALAVYDQFRALLIDQLGVEPGARLRRMRAEIASPRDNGVAAPRSPIPPSGGGFVGRESELVTVRSALSGVLKGTGTAVWVEGEPGIGKSALLATGLSDAADRGCEVFWSAGTEARRRLPLDVMLTSLALDTAQGGAQWVELMTGLLGHTSGAGNERDGYDDQLIAVDQQIVVMDRFLALVEELCADGPVVLVTEDLQWSDDASLLVWHRLAKATRRLPLLLVGSCRPDGHRPELDPLRTAVSSVDGALVRLQPLDAAASADVVRTVLGAEPGADLLGMTEWANGNPRYLVEVVQALMHDDAVSVFGDVVDLDESGPTSYPAVNALLNSRLDHLGTATRDVVRAASLLGTEFELGDLVTVSRRSACELLPVIEEAAASGVIEEMGQKLAFRHVQVRQAVYESMPASVRVMLHRQAAEALEIAGAPVERVAEQLLHGPVPADAWVTRWLLDHTSATAGRTPALAVELLKYAVGSLGGRDEVREELVTRLTRLLFWLGESPAAEARTVLRTTSDPDRAAEMRLLLAHFDSRSGHGERAAESLRKAMTDVTLPDRWRAGFGTVLAALEHTAYQEVAGTGSDVPRSRGNREAGAVAQESERRWEMASAGRRHSEALDHVNRGLAALSGHPKWADLELLLLDHKILTLHNLDDLPEAGRTLDEAQHLVTRAGLTSGPHIRAAVHNFWAGDWCAALNELDVVVRDHVTVTAYDLRQFTAIPVLHGIRALVAAYRDQSVELEKSLKAAALHPQRIDEAQDDFLSMAHSVAAEQRGRQDDAVRALLPLLNDDCPPLVPRHQWMPRLARLALEHGDRALAESALAVCQAELDRGGASPRAWTATQWCGGLLERDPAALRTVVKSLSAAGRKVEFAAASEDLSALLASQGHLDDAYAAHYDAVTIYKGLSASWAKHRAESRLRSSGVRRRGGDHRSTSGGPLTEIESRIAELVSEGWPNPDIAARLMTSHNIVQSHVSSLMSKLGVDSRLGITRQVLDRHRGAGSG